MSPEFLQAFAPFMGVTTPDDPHANILASIAGPMPQPNLSGLPALATPAPEIRAKRTIGNVLHDLLTDHVDSQGVPVSEKIARLGDAFSNAAREWRGENPVNNAGVLTAARLQQAEAQQQNAEWQRQNQARAAFADLLTNPTPEGVAALAKVAPELASGYLQQQQVAQHQAAQEAHQNRLDEFNMGKPVSVGGNTYLTPKEGGGWEEHQIPLPPGFQIVNSADGQTYVVDKKSGQPVRQIGGKKAPTASPNKVVTVQDANGNSVLQMIDPQGNLVRTIGAAPAKGNAPSTQDQVANTLSDMGITLSGAKDPVADLIKASTSGTLERVGSAIPAFFGDTTPGRKAIAQLHTISKAITFALANGKLGAGFSDADRNFIEEQGGKIDDPSIPIGERLAAWQQVRERLRNRVYRESAKTPTSSSVASAPVKTMPEQAAELKRRGYHFDGSRWVK